MTTSSTVADMARDYWSAAATDAFRIGRGT